ncbi:hypothetical protein [Haloglycomyces albus]|uniref:hypothetical protein n=1 Tax=Haloglycomyces albus TaxID=526067 RepID=UPI00046D54E3|nr:hypothetical protein [Haloglycomyces albus]
MSSGERKLDPEALEEFITKAREQIDVIEDELVKKLRPGEVLGKQPAFGHLGSSDSAQETYEGFHRSTWDNLQNFRLNLYGLIDIAEKAIESSRTDEDASQYGFNKAADDLT